MDGLAHLEGFFHVAQERDFGVIAKKLCEHDDLVKKGFTGNQLICYVLSHPVSTTIVGFSELSHLEENVQIAQAFEPLIKQEMEEIKQS